MQQLGTEVRFTARLVDSLYVEAMVLADEARAYFDEAGREERDGLTPLMRVGFSCESLKVTTRLMHVIAWLLTRRAVETGELSLTQAMTPARRLGDAAPSDEETVTALPPTARGLVETSRDLYNRVWRLDREIDRQLAADSPARGLMQRLEGASF